AVDLLSRVTEQLPFLDHRRHLGRYHDFPSPIALLDASEDILGENGQAAFVIIPNRLDEIILPKIGVEVLQVRGDAQVSSSNDRAGVMILDRVNVKFERVFEQAPEGLQDAAVEIGIILLVENLPK